MFLYVPYFHFPKLPFTKKEKPDLIWPVKHGKPRVCLASLVHCSLKFVKSLLWKFIAPHHVYTSGSKEAKLCACFKTQSFNLYFNIPAIHSVNHQLLIELQTDPNLRARNTFSAAAVFQGWLGLGLLQPHGSCLAGQPGVKAVAFHWVVQLK